MMKTFLTISLLLLAGFAPRSFGAESDAAVVAREAALEVAGAFSNDGFKLRDGHWSGALEKGKPVLLTVNLYCGDSYWFSAAASNTDARLEIAIFDEKGKPLKADLYKDAARVVAGISATASGQYFVQIRQTEGSPSTLSFVYSYK